LIEKKMLAKLKKLFPYILFQDIETSTTLGFPDVVYGYKNVIGFMELKEINRMPVRKFTVPWRPGQLAWWTNYRLKYKNKSPYLLVLTLKDSWYFISTIKETYTMVEANIFYIGETNDLVCTKDKILHVLFPVV